MSWQDKLRKVKYVGRTGEKYLIPFITDLLKQQNAGLLESCEILKHKLFQIEKRAEHNQKDNVQFSIILGIVSEGLATIENAINKTKEQ